MQTLTARTTEWRRVSEYCNLVLFCATSVSLVALQIGPIGLPFLAAGLITLLGCSPKFRNNMFLIYVCLLVLFIMPIHTRTDFPDALYMGIGLATVVLLPFIVTRKIYKNDLIRFPSLKEKRWPLRRTLYVLFIALAGWLLIPFMLRSTNSYPNWQFEPDFWNSFEAYMGLNAVGIWDELFFVCTVFAILRGFFPWMIANLAQAFLFASFLHTLAFEGWCVIIIFLFALLQGYIFMKTKSLLFILAIHLTVDLVLHLAIHSLLHPGSMPFMIT